MSHPCAGILDPVLAENYPGRERKGRTDSARSYSRVAFFTTAFLTVFDGIGLDTAAALLPIFLILLPLELIWRRFSCTYEPIRS